MNQYVWCVINNDMKGEQFKIMWYVDDINTSHKDPEVVTTIIDIISSICGRESPLTVTHRKFHEYLGMTIDFSEKVKVISPCMTTFPTFLKNSLKT